MYTLGLKNTPEKIAIQNIQWKRNETKRNGANDSEVVCCIIDAAIAIVNLFSHTTKTAAEAAAAAE